MRRTTIRIIGASAAALLLVSCGSDNGDDAPVADAGVEADAAVAEDDTDTEIDPADEDEAPADSDADSEEGGDTEPSGTVQGTVTVNGTEYQITQMRNCEPAVHDMIDIELELQGLGRGDSSSVQIDLYVQTVGGAQLDRISWAGPEGIFNTDSATIDYEAGAGTVEGTETLLDSMTMEDSIILEYSLSIPNELIACR